MSKEAANKAHRLAVELARQAAEAGASSVVILIGMPDGELHSAFNAQFHGKCLEVRGLLEIGAENVRRRLVFPDAHDVPVTTEAGTSGARVFYVRD